MLSGADSRGKWGGVACGDLSHPPATGQRQFGDKETRLLQDAFVTVSESIPIEIRRHDR